MQPVFISEPPEPEIYNESSIGLIIFTLVCKVSELSQAQQASSSTNQGLQAAKDAITQSNLDKFIEGYKYSVRTMNDVSSRITDFAVNIQKAANTINGLTDPLTNFTQALQTLQFSIGTILKTPKVLANNLANVFENFEQIGESASDQFLAAKQVLTTNYFDIIFKRSQIESEKNAAITPINSYIWTESMNICLISAANSTYDTKEQITATQDFLNDQYRNNADKITDNNLQMEILIE